MSLYAEYMEEVDEMS